MYEKVDDFLFVIHQKDFGRKWRKVCVFFVFWVFFISLQKV